MTNARRKGGSLGSMMSCQHSDAMPHAHQRKQRVEVVHNKRILHTDRYYGLLSGIVYSVWCMVYVYPLLRPALRYSV
jgi:hypothetical protein